MARRRRAAVTIVIASAGVATHALTAAKHFHVISPNLSGILFNAVFIAIFARFQVAFDVDLRAFFQVLPGDFSDSAEEGNAMPFGLLLFSLVTLSFQVSVVATVMFVTASPLGI